MMVRFGDMKVNGMVSNCRLELSSFAYLLCSTIAHQLIWDMEVRNELLQRLTSTALVLHRVCGGKERFISKDLCVFVTIKRFVVTIHGVHVDCATNARSYKHPVRTILPCQWEYGRPHQPLCGDLEGLCRLTQSNVSPLT